MADVKWFGERLRVARERRGLNQQEVADALGLPRTAVTNMETGNRQISTLELSKLAKLYRRSPAWFFEGENAQVEDSATVLLRAIETAVGSPEFTAAIDQVWALCCEGANLRKLLGRELEQVIPSYASKLKSAGEAIRQGADVAREERRRLGLGNAPIGPIAELIGIQGIWVAACRLPDDMSGLFISEQSIGLSIIVNEGHAPVRRRFSYAHEYGHALFDRDEGYRLTRTSNASELAETRANAFAAAFLMPPGGVLDQLRQLDKGRPSRQSQIIFDNTKDFDSIKEPPVPVEAEIRPRTDSQTVTYQDVRHLARHFGVSYESSVWRLKNLDLIRHSEVTPLLEQKSKSLSLDEVLKVRFGDILPPPDDREMQLHGQLVRLAIEAYRREEISQGRLRDLAAILDVPVDMFIYLADAARGD